LRTHLPSFMAWTFVVFFGCQQAESKETSSDISRVIGADDRVEETRNQFPASSVLLMQIGVGNSWLPCTGVLVGKSTVLTAAHCLKTVLRRDNDPSLQKTVFRITDGNGGFLPEFFRMSAWALPTRKSDLALVVLEKPLGVTLRYFSIPKTPPKPPVIVESISFASDRFAQGSMTYFPLRHSGCSLLTYDPQGVQLPDGDVGFDCDTTGGSSGGPLFSWNENTLQAELQAIVTGGYKVSSAESYEEYPNYGYSVAKWQAFVEAVNRIEEGFRSVTNTPLGFEALDHYLKVYNGLSTDWKTLVIKIIAFSEAQRATSGRRPTWEELNGVFGNLAEPLPTPTPNPTSTIAPPSPTPTFWPTIFVTYAPKMYGIAPPKKNIVKVK
jgi:V8-like Glu-specific endopeptidase